MKVVNAYQMKNIDKNTIEKIKIPGIILMENAAYAVFEVLKEKFDDLTKIKVSIFAGTGNNGGDGFALARILINFGVYIKVYLIGQINKIKKDALVNLKILEKIGASIIKVNNFKKINLIEKEISKSNLIIDALLGTGIKGEIKGLIKKVIELINVSKKPIISIDIPSGLNTDTGFPEGVCIKSTLTVTFQLPKIGLVVSPGINYCGRLIVKNIGIPASVIEREKIKINLITKEDVKIPPRLKDTHKGSYGHILILGGSEGLTGAVVLSSLAALRSGAGFVTLGIPKSLNYVLEEKLTEVVTLPLEETNEKTLSSSSLKDIYSKLKKINVLAIGPGLSVNKDTIKLTEELIKKVKIPLVIDADGLNALSRNLKVLKKKKTEIILTPHLKEFALLIKKDLQEIKENKIFLGTQFVKEFRVILILKDSRTLIFHYNGDIYINSKGNPGMATAGMGDVLTGMIASFIGQGFDILKSCIISVYFHSLAGDLVSEEKGEISLIASDIIEKLPYVIKNHIEKE